MAFNLADMVNKRPKQVQQENTSDTVYRDVFKLVPSKENFYGTDPDRLQGLKNSIQLFGVMQDVLIEDVNGEDHIISGHCRTMCCRMLVEEGHEEFRKINCKYTTVKDDTRKMFLEDGEEDHETTQLLEKLAVIQANRFREKTDWEKMKEALETEEIIKGLRELTELKGKTRDMVRETIGVSGTQMERYHAVQKKLSPEWMKEFQSAKINITVARELADLDETYQKKAMEHYEDHDGITGAEIKAFKSLQENNRDIPGQFTIEQAIGQQRPPENDTPVQPELQIERLFEALNKGEKERVLKCDTRMAAYLISIRYRDVRIRNGHFNYQASKEGITFNPDSIMQSSLTWNELSEELVKRFGKKQKPVRIVSIDAPEKTGKKETNSGKCIHREGFNCTLSEAQKVAEGSGENCNEKCCWNCKKHGDCGYECNSSAHRPIEQPEQKEKTEPAKCITGQSGSGQCGAAAYCDKGYNCCAQCPDDCNGRCGWIESCQPAAEPQDEKQQSTLTETEAVKALLEKYPNKLKTIMRICRKYKKDGEAAKETQKKIAPYGWSSIAGSEVEYTFMGFAEGLEITVKKEKVKMKYGRLIAEAKNLYNPFSPEFDTEEDHSGEDTEMASKTQIPETWPEYLKDIPIPTDTALASYLYDQERDLKQILDIEKEEPGLPYMTIMQQQMVVAGLRLLQNCVKSMKEPEQPPLPEMKNNDQRKEWLRNHKAWGLWYTDPHTEARYYKYDFDNGARLIAEEYDPEPKDENSWWVPTESCYLHLVGGPEPERAGGVPKWTYHPKYNKFPNSETELIEFLKEIQK